MSLQIITGSSGNEKSLYAKRKMVKAASENPDKSFFCIVPEQYTMQVQKELVGLHPDGCIMNIEVLSLARLAMRVFEETGVDRMPILEDIGKGLVLQKMILDNAGDFGVLKRTLLRHGAAEQLKSLISELIQYRITPNDLEKWKDYPTTGALLSEKLSDIRLVYESFQRYLDKKYLTAEEVPEILSTVIEKSEMLKNSTVLFDGFTGFVPTQLLVIGKLLKLCESVSVVITAGTGEELLKTDKCGLFSMSRKMAKELMLLASDAGAEILPEIRIDTKIESPDLAFVEANLFRFGKQEVKRGSVEDISVYEAKDPEGEAENAAALILKGVRSGHRFSDYAILSSDLEGRRRVFSDVFKRAGIPLFIDEKNDILSNMLTGFLRAAVSIPLEGFSYDSVMRYLRSGLSDVEPDETDLLETYISAAGIKGKKKYETLWQKATKTVPAEKLDEANRIREKFLSEISSFAESFSGKGKTVKERTEALYYLMRSLKAEEKLKEKENFLSAAGNAARADEYSRIYAAVCDLMDRIVEILGDEKTSLSDYQKLLDAGLSELRLGFIPQGQDMVIAGDLKRTRIGNVRVLFITGLNEGLFPSVKARTSLLSEKDREGLLCENVILSDDPLDEIIRQRFYLYMYMTQPTEKCILSYSRTSLSEDAMMPSSAIRAIMKLFPELNVSVCEECDKSLFLESDAGREKLLLEGFADPEKLLSDPMLLETAKSYLLDDKKKKIYLDMVRAAARRKPVTDISKRTAKLLYGEAAMLSPSRLTLYAGCAFAHFLKYGLLLKEKEISRFTGADFGTILHGTVDRFSKLVKAENADWMSMPEDLRRDLTERAFTETISELYPDSFGETKREGNIRERLKETVNTVIWAFTEQIKKGKLVPSEFELPFYTAHAKGRIDRVDCAELDGKTYIRVIDYKSGSESLDLSLLYYGLQLQLPLYMSGALAYYGNKGKKDTEPAGIYYFKMDDPFLEAESPDADKDESEFLKALKLDGISRSENEILRLHDSLLSEGKSSDVIPVTITKAGDVKSGNPAFPGEDFRLIEKYTTAVTDEMAGGIMSGCADINPKSYRKKGKSGITDSCIYCPYKGVCGFDTKVPGYEKKRLKEMDAFKALDAMRKKLTEGGTADGD